MRLSTALLPASLSAWQFIIIRPSSWGCHAMTQGELEGGRKWALSTKLMSQIEVEVDSMYK